MRIEWSRAKMPSMGIYSMELRIRAVDAVERGIPRKDVVQTFSISLTTLKRWLRKRRDGEDLSPGTSTGRKWRILATLEVLTGRTLSGEQGAVDEVGG